MRNIDAAGIAYLERPMNKKPQANLPTNPKARKERPMARGVLDYFPDALAEIAHVSFIGNEQHNPGEEMYWARDKSKDHPDCILRHLAERGTMDTDGLSHSAKMAWRALALLQIEIEGGLPACENVMTISRERYDDLIYLSTPRGLWHITARDGDIIKLPLGIDTHLMALVGYVNGAVPVHKIRGTLVDGELCVNGVSSESMLTALPDPADLGEQSPTPRVYIAGPMRGLPKLNFPAFDQACNQARVVGYDPISPADIDRSHDIHEDTPPESIIGPAAARVFAERDCKALIGLRSEDGDAIAMLPGWEKSTGARAEFFLAMWVGLKVLDAITMVEFVYTATQAAKQFGRLDSVKDAAYYTLIGAANEK